MDFKTVTTLSAALLALLGLTWIFGGQLMLRRWRLAPSDVALLVGRRLGTIYVGLAALIAACRELTPGPAQQAFASGALVFCVLLAGIGLYEFVRKRVAPAILISVGVELLLALAYAALVMGKS